MVKRSKEFYSNEGAIKQLLPGWSMATILGIVDLKDILVGVCFGIAFGMGGIAIKELIEVGLSSTEIIGTITLCSITLVLGIVIAKGL